MKRSLTTAVVLACLLLLGIGLWTAYAFSRQTERVFVDPIYHSMDLLELGEARTAWQRGGNGALGGYLSNLDRQFGGQHFLLDGTGRDLKTGLNESALLPAPPATRSRGERDGVYIITQRSDDGRYWFVANKLYSSPAISFVRFYLRVYLLLAALVLSLGTLCTVYIVMPLKRMAGVVRAFNMGDGNPRIQMERPDEIGELATSFNEMADRLEASFRRGRQLLQDVSHELRAPLARLSFSIQLARSAPDRDAALDEIKRDLDRLNYLVSELTALSVGRPGDALASANTHVDLEHIVLASVRDCELEAAAKHCTLECTGSAHDLIAGEPEQLRRAVDNVLRNAVRHSPVGSPIHVCLQQTHEWSSVTVRDFGSGVPEDLLDRIFDPFFQVKTARSAAQDGLGLGLCIARRSVELHRGSIVAENERPGLRIRLSLPTMGVRV